MRVLFVCTANISRSPYAERRAVQLALDDASLEFASAGVPGVDGRAMDPAMVVELKARGGSAVGHASRVLSASILEASDVVLTAEFAHRMRITERWPDHAPKVFGLRQLADALRRSPASKGGLAALDHALSVAHADGLTWDVADPYRRGAAAAARAARDIDEALGVVLPALSTRASARPGD